MERLTRVWGEAIHSPFVRTGEIVQRLFSVDSTIGHGFLLVWQSASIRYARLHRLWLNHGIAEKVTHNTEASPGAELLLYCEALQIPFSQIFVLFNVFMNTKRPKMVKCVSLNSHPNFCFMASLYFNQNLKMLSSGFQPTDWISF